MTFEDTLGIAGTGALGSALARAALAHGLAVSVWNRTPARTAALIGLGATGRSSPADLVASAPVIVTVLSTYADVRAVLGTGGELHRHVVVNLASGSPTESATMAAEVHGADGLASLAWQFERAEIAK